MYTIIPLLIWPLGNSYCYNVIIMYHEIYLDGRIWNSKRKKRYWIEKRYIKIIKETIKENQSYRKYTKIYDEWMIVTNDTKRN